MNNFEKIQKIEAKLVQWEEDLNPVYENKVSEFFGRFLRKIESGVQKLGYFIFVTHKWETKQERYLHNFEKQWIKIEKILNDTDPQEKRALFKQIKKLDKLCELLLQKEDKINKKNVNSLKQSFKPLIEDHNNIIRDDEDIQAAIEANLQVEEEFDEDEDNQIPKAFFPPKKVLNENKEVAKPVMEQKPPVDLAPKVDKERIEDPRIIEQKQEEFEKKNKEMELAPKIDKEVDEGFNDEDIQAAIEASLQEEEEFDDDDVYNQTPKIFLPPKKVLNNNKEAVPKPVIMQEKPLIEPQIPPIQRDLVIKKEKENKEIEAQKPKPRIVPKQEPERQRPPILVPKNNLKIIDKGNMHPLHLAAREGEVEKMKALMPMDLNIQDNEGRTALSLVSELELGKKNSCIKWLLENGANINIADKEGRLPLHYGASMGYTNTHYLIPTDINIQDNEGRTALSYAVEKEKVTVNQLLDKGADINIADEKGNLPLHYAAMAGHDDCFHILLSKYHVSIDVKGMNDRTALSFAAEAGSEKIVKELLRKGAQASSVDEYGNTPLHYAARKGILALSPLMQELMMKAPDDVFLKNYEGKTAYDLAKEAGQKGVLAAYKQRWPQYID